MSLPALLAAALIGAAPPAPRHKAPTAAPAAPAPAEAAAASTSEGGPAHQPFPEVPPPTPVEHPLDIVADHLTVLGKENRGVWKGHVHAVRAGTNGQPDVHLKCNELTTLYKQESKDKQTLDTVICVGEVQVVQGDRAGWGERAVFDNAKGFLVVTGNPHGQQGPNTFKGDRLTFDVNSDRIDVENVKSKTEGKEGGLTGGEPGKPGKPEARKEPRP